MTLGDLVERDQPSDSPMRSLPMIVYDEPDAARRGRRHAGSGWRTSSTCEHVASPERLLDQTACCPAPPRRRSCPRRSGRCSSSCTTTDAVLAGKKVLIVDDDIRNIFALTSMLEQHNMEILSAETGRDAIRSAAGHSPTSTSC